MTDWARRKNKFNSPGVRPFDTSKWDTRARQIVHGQGLRYLTMRGIVWSTRARTGQANWVTPDLYFERHRLAVFLDGCYWHGCRECARYTHADRYDRDRRVDASLTAQGYRVLRIWEHDGAEEAARQIIAAVRD